MTALPLGSSQRRSALVFTLVLAAVYTTAIVVGARLSELDDAAIVALGITLDVVVVVPAAFYFLVVRRFHLPRVLVVPAVILGMVAASRLLPSEHHTALEAIEWLAVPLELGLVGWVAWRTARAVRSRGRLDGADPFEHMIRIARDLLGNERAARIVASELAIFHYALGSWRGWRARPHVPATARAFTHHERSGHGGIVVAVLFLLAVEGLVVHVMLALWSPIVAWIATAGTVYGALFLVADYRATVLRPILVDRHEVAFRAGLRWSATVPMAAIAGIGAEPPVHARDALKLPLVGEVTCWVRLSEPVVAIGPYGITRRISAIGMAPDARDELVRSLGALIDPVRPER